MMNLESCVVSGKPRFAFLITLLTILIILSPIQAQGNGPELQITPDNGTVCTEVVIEGYNFYGIPTAITIGGMELVAPGSLPKTLVDLDGDTQFDDFRITGLNIPWILNSGVCRVCAQAPGESGSPLFVETTFNTELKLIAVSPAAGPPETNITIEGTGFCPGDDLYSAIILYGNSAKSELMTIVPIAIDNQGDFVATGKIPWNVSPGLRDVIVFFNPDNPGVFDPANPNQVSAYGLFTVVDRDITIVPNNIPYGTMVTISGGDFGHEADDAVPDMFVNYHDVNLEGIDNQQLSSNGDLIPVPFEVTPDLGFQYGENVVEIMVEVDGLELISNTIVNVTRPTLEIDPFFGPRGSVITAKGSGWLTGQTDFVTVDYMELGKLTMNTFAIIRPNSQGEIATQFSVPSIHVGGTGVPLMIYATDDSDNRSLVSMFNITLPMVNVEPDAAAPGDSITVSGSGFYPDHQIQEVSISDTPIIPSQELGMTDSTGSFEVEGTVPGLMVGGYALKVRVTQDEGEEITIPFMVLTVDDSEITVEEGFDTIEGKYTTVWTFNADTQEWEVYQPDLPDWVPRFDVLNSGQGYWVEISEDCTLTYGANTWNMKEGWNLIGWLS